MALKIVLIDPPHVYLMQQNTQAPMGLLYLASVLEKIGNSVEIVRLDIADQEQWEKGIPDADLYGISAVSLDYNTAKDIAKVLKKRKKPIIIGGYHVTADLQNVLKNDLYIWDSICVGEGENIILEVVKDFENKSLKKVYYSKLEPDINKFPFPARHLINEQGSNIFAYDRHYVENRLSTVLVSSRGCPFLCSFCGTQAMWERNVRFRSIENIMEEIDFCIREYGIRQFRMSDDVFTLNKKRTLGLMRHLSTRKIHWKCSTRTDCIDLEVLRSMRDAGCEEIAFGIESVDPNVLRLLNKKTNVEKDREALFLTHKVGINTRLLLMIGTPGETIETVDKNIEFLETTPYTCTSLTVFKPLPGSDIWKNPAKYKVKILSRDLSEYNIYMWAKGKLDENRNEHIVRILTLPSVKHQIKNKKRMLEYFLMNERMTELKSAKKQISFWIHGIPQEENLYLDLEKEKSPQTQRQFIYQELWKTINHFVPEQFKTSLEIGCGRGTISQYLKKRRGFTMTLVDSHIDLVKLAQRNFARIQEKASFLSSQIRALPFKSDQFDLVVAIGVIEHYPEIKEVLKEMGHVLRKGGKFICYYAPKKWSIQYLVNYIFKRKDYYRNKISLKEFERFLIEHGFKIDAGFYVNPYPVFQDISKKEEKFVVYVYSLISKIKNVFGKFTMKSNRFFSIGYFVSAVNVEDSRAK